MDKKRQINPLEMNIKITAEIGQLIQRERKKLGLSQKEAALMCNVGTRFLSDLENGKPGIQLGKTMQVLRSFGLVLTIRKKSLVNE